MLPGLEYTRMMCALKTGEVYGLRVHGARWMCCGHACGALVPLLNASIKWSIASVQARTFLISTSGNKRVLLPVLALANLANGC